MYNLLLSTNYLLEYQNPFKFECPAVDEWYLNFNNMWMSTKMLKVTYSERSVTKTWKDVFLHCFQFLRLRCLCFHLMLSGGCFLNLRVTPTLSIPTDATWFKYLSLEKLIKNSSCVKRWARVERTLTMERLSPPGKVGQMPLIVIIGVFNH